MKFENEHVQEKVYATAKKFLYRYGVKGWNMEMLAKEVGLARNTLYKIIESKEKLIEDIVLSHLRTNVESLISNYLGRNDLIVNYVNRKDSDSKKAIVAIIYEAIEKFITQMEHFEPVILPQVYKEYPAIETKTTTLMEQYKDRSYYIFEFGKNIDFLHNDVDPAACMDVLSAIVNFYIQQGVEKDVFEDRVKKILKYMVRGIMA